MFVACEEKEGWCESGLLREGFLDLTMLRLAWDFLLRAAGHHVRALLGLEQCWALKGVGKGHSQLVQGPDEIDPRLSLVPPRVSLRHSAGGP